MKTLNLNPGRAVLPRRQAEQQLSPTNKALSLVLSRLEAQRRPFCVALNDDERVIKLSARTAEVGDDAFLLAYCRDGDTRKQNLANLRFDLSNLAAFVLHWLGGINPAGLIIAERERQRELFRTGRIAFNVASPVPDHRRKFRVLIEEVGEVAHAIDQIENHGMATGNRNVELTQVAAVCVAWLESLEGEDK